MDATSHAGLSWDTGAAEINLRTWLSGAGHCDASAGSLRAAMQHMSMHSEGTKQARCGADPCRAFGVSAALFEIGMFRGQLEGGRALLEFEAIVRSAHTDVSSVARSLARGHTAFEAFATEAHVRDASDTGVLHRHQPWCADPQRLVAQANELSTILERFAALMRKPFLSAQIRLEPRRGNRKQVLLIGVCQHLHKEGFSLEEVVELVATHGIMPTDNASTKRRKMESAVAAMRFKVAEPDQREYQRFLPDESTSEI